MRLRILRDAARARNRHKNDFRRDSRSQLFGLPLFEVALPALPKKDHDEVDSRDLKVSSTRVFIRDNTLLDLRDSDHGSTLEKKLNIPETIRECTSCLSCEYSILTDMPYFFKSVHEGDMHFLVQVGCSPILLLLH